MNRAELMNAYSGEANRFSRQESLAILSSAEGMGSRLIDTEMAQRPLEAISTLATFRDYFLTKGPVEGIRSAQFVLALADVARAQGHSEEEILDAINSAN